MPPQIYLDYHASTPCDPRVVEAMLPYFVESFANPASVHRPGEAAADAVERARAAVAAAIGARPVEIVFTSGATESNNLAILGAAAAGDGSRRKILASAIEHKAVLEAGRALARRGWEFLTVPVLSDGLLDFGALVELLDERTLLVSVQAANNEIGTIQSIPEIARLTHRVGALFHCDAAQALGRVPIDAEIWDVDLLSLSAHKCYGPKGVGALFVRGGPRAPHLEPIMFGGGQEGGLRPGTVNVPGVVGFGRACMLAGENMPDEVSRVTRLRDWFENLILDRVPDTRRNGAVDRRLPGNSSLRFKGVDAEALIANLGHIALSTGSACTSGAPEPSHVLTAIGLTRQQAYSTIRIGIGRFTSPNELERAARDIAEAVCKIRSSCGVAVG